MKRNLTWRESDAVLAGLFQLEFTAYGKTRDKTLKHDLHEMTVNSGPQLTKEELGELQEAINKRRVLGIYEESVAPVSHLDRLREHAVRLRDMWIDAEAELARREREYAEIAARFGPDGGLR